MSSLRRLLAAAAVTLVSLSLVAEPAQASGHDARARREQVRKQRAAAAAQLDALRAQDRAVRAALESMSANVRAQQAATAAAERAVSAAVARLAEAQRREAATADRLANLRSQLRDAAVRAFVEGAGVAPRVGPGEGGDLAETARKRVLRDVAAGSADDVQDQLRATREDLAVARAEAERASSDAAARRRAARGRLGQLTAARAQQAAFGAKVEQRIEARLAEATSLASLDSALSAQIAREQAALALRNRAPGVARGAVPTRSAPVPLRNVRGIWVHEQMADRLEGLLAAAEADGYVLGGGGYRDPAAQRRLRRANCPSPERSPASSCRPPTARPGQSMHEEGLAVDFTWNGRVITSRSSPAFQWMRANAARFGMYNLPSEPWHWSVNGD